MLVVDVHALCMPACCHARCCRDQRAEHATKTRRVGPSTRTTVPCVVFEGALLHTVIFDPLSEGLQTGPKSRSPSAPPREARETDAHARWATRTSTRLASSTRPGPTPPHRTPRRRFVCSTCSSCPCSGAARWLTHRAREPERRGPVGWSGGVPTRREWRRARDGPAWIKTLHGPQPSQVGAARLAYAVV